MEDGIQVEEVKYAKICECGTVCTCFLGPKPLTFVPSLEGAHHDLRPQ